VGVFFIVFVGRVDGWVLRVGVGCSAGIAVRFNRIVLMSILGLSP